MNRSEFAAKYATCVNDNDLILLASLISSNLKSTTEAKTFLSENTFHFEDGTYTLVAYARKHGRPDIVKLLEMSGIYDHTYITTTTITAVGLIAATIAILFVF